MYLAFVITWLPFLEFNCYFREVTKRGYLHFQCNSKGLSYKLTILHLAGFNSPPPLFFFLLYIPPISYLLRNNIELDLFNLSWVSCHGVEIEHFNMSRLGVPNHTLSIVVQSRFPANNVNDQVNRMQASALLSDRSSPPSQIL